MRQHFALQRCHSNKKSLNEAHDKKLRRNAVVLLMKTNLDQLMHNGTKQLGTNQSKLWN